MIKKYIINKITVTTMCVILLGLFYLIPTNNIQIEKEEIIFTLEVTNKLEEAHSKYKEGSQKEKDQLAIEIGKLLVKQILYNTEDRTGLIDKIQENETA